MKEKKLNFNIFFIITAFLLMSIIVVFRANTVKEDINVIEEENLVQINERKLVLERVMAKSVPQTSKQIEANFKILQNLIK